MTPVVLGNIIIQSNYIFDSNSNTYYYRIKHTYLFKTKEHTYDPTFIYILHKNKTNHSVQKKKGKHQQQWVIDQPNQQKKKKKNKQQKKQTKKFQSTKIHYLKELKPNSNTSYRIKVKAIRVWKSYYMEAPSKANKINAQIWGEPVLNYNINMILMDEEVSLQIFITDKLLTTCILIKNKTFVIPQNFRVQKFMRARITTQYSNVHLRNH